MVMETKALNWGSTLVRRRVRGFEALVYEPRPRGLSAVLDQSLEWGDSPFLIAGERSESFRSFQDHVGRTADGLVTLGVGPGDHVMLLANNSIDWIIAFWSIICSGAVVVLGNAWWSQSEIESALDVTQPRLVIIDSQFEGRLGAWQVVPIGELPQAPAPGSPSERYQDEDATAIILFTSGTTGLAKGAMLSHRSLIATLQGFLVLTGRLPSPTNQAATSTRILLSTPLFHIGGVNAVLTAMMTDTTLILTQGRFDPQQILDLIQEHHVTVWSGVPTMISRVVNSPNLDSYDLSSVKSVGVGGAPLPPVVLKRAADAFPRAEQRITTNYGLSEAAGIIASASGADVLSHPGTSGRPLPSVELLIDEPAGSPGEIMIRSASLMSGYWNTEESPIDHEGWLHTGDVGYLDDDGFLYVVDRTKDIIIRGGRILPVPTSKLPF